MGDTKQVVQWALENSCPMRSGENWTTPEVTRDQLTNTRIYSMAYTSGNVVHDVCVSFWGKRTYKQDKKVKLPTFGFKISDTFNEYGGLEIVTSSCRNCPANISKTYLAGCSDTFYLPPESSDLERWLKDTITRLNLAERFQRAFVQTQPLWFGLWINSPLTDEQCEILYALLSNLKDIEPELQTFLLALQTSIEQKIKLHVSLAPYGHIDLGWETTFSHCPRCKASSQLSKPIRQPAATNKVECTVCGYHYNEHETGSSKQSGLTDFFGPYLQTVLGAKEYDRFIRECLSNQGFSRLEIEEIIISFKDDLTAETWGYSQIA